MIETFTNSKTLIKVPGKDREMQLSRVKTGNIGFTEATLQRGSDIFGNMQQIYRKTLMPKCNFNNFE